MVYRAFHCLLEVNTLQTRNVSFVYDGYHKVLPKSVMLHTSAGTLLTSSRVLFLINKVDKIHRIELCTW